MVVVAPILWTLVVAFRDLRLRTLQREGIFGSGFTLDNFTSALQRRGHGARDRAGLVAALIVRDRFRGRTAVRALMLLPYIAPVVAVTFLWQVMLDPNLGVVNALGLDRLGWEKPGSIILTVPIILVFLLAERLLVEGLTAGAEKG